MFKINDLLAKALSKVVKGILGTIIHYFIIGFIYDQILVLILLLLGIDKNSTQVNSKALSISVVLGLGIMTLKWIGTIRAYKVYKNASIIKSNKFGKARFSESKEITDAGLQGSGIVFGKIDKKLITKPSTVEGHTLVVGGTGTGKSRGVVIPTLFKWEGSAIVMDIKGELSKVTSSKRKTTGNVYIFNPEGECDCYDPIKLCNTVDQAQDLARVLIPTPKSGESFWAQSAQAILSAFVYEGALNGDKLTDIAEKLCTTPIIELVKHCRNSDIREVRLLASISYDLPEKTLGGVIGELKTRLITIATDPNIRRATQKSDWTPQTLEEGATVYLKVSEHLLEQYKDLWTVIINQILKYLSKREEGKNPPILIALDEMPRLSKLNGLTSALATLRSRNVHILSIIQSMAQLDEIYGKNERKVISDNCRFKLVLSATDPETQKYFSDLVGQKTIFSETLSPGFITPNRSYSEQGVPLIRTEEWANLDKPILLAPKLNPTRLDLAFWDKENLI